MFSGFNVSVIGASHITNGTVCQDNSGYFCGKEFAVAAVSDGHGSKKHFRSGIGSKIAVNVTIEAVKEFWKKRTKSKYQLPGDTDDVLRQLEGNIIFRWNTDVNQHFNETPLTDDEKQICNETGIELDKPERFYGATLIVGLMCEKFAFAMKIGDGACVFINENNEPSLPPALEDERLGFGLTSSLCDSDAIKNFRHFYTEDVPVGIIVASDGVTDSYTSDDFLKFNAKIICSVQEDFASTTQQLEEWLSVLSEKGSRDDMSISLVYEGRLTGDNLIKKEDAGNILNRFWSKVSGK